MKLYVLLFILWFASLTVAAQKKNNYGSQNYVGLLEGSERSRFQIQTIHGIKFANTWYAGIGTGLDYYFFRSVPLFLSATKNFCSCERTFFASVNAGYNWVWDETTGNWANYYSKGDFSPRPFYEASMGYRIGLRNKKDAVLLNMGYSVKKAREKIDGVIWWCDFPPCPTPNETIDYSFRRLSLKVGWEF